MTAFIRATEPFGRGGFLNREADAGIGRLMETIKTLPATAEALDISDDI